MKFSKVFSMTSCTIYCMLFISTLRHCFQLFWQRSILFNAKGVMYRVCSLQLCPNIAVRPAIIRKFYLRLTVDKMHTSEVFNKKYLRSYRCSSTSITVTVNCTNLNIEIHGGIIEI